MKELCIIEPEMFALLRKAKDENRVLNSMFVNANIELKNRWVKVSLLWEEI